MLRRPYKSGVHEGFYMKASTGSDGFWSSDLIGGHGGGNQKWIKF